MMKLSEPCSLQPSLKDISLLKESRQRDFGPIPFLQPIRLLTVPKSGTHLLEKALQLMGYPKQYFGPPHHVYYGSRHLINWDKKNIMMVRDCRDVLVSLVHHVDKIVDSYLQTGQSLSSGFVENPQKWASWKKKSFDEKLMDAITQNNQTGYDFTFYNKEQWIHALALKPCLKLQANQLMLTRFEDLIGESGGGSSESQQEELRKIGRFLSISLSDQQIQSIQKNLFGGTTTFHKGQIGKWKECFKPEHVQAFLPRFQKYLEAFGYEKDDSWAAAYLKKDRLDL